MLAALTLVLGTTLTCQDVQSQFFASDCCGDGDLAAKPATDSVIVRAPAKDVVPTFIDNDVVGDIIYKSYGINLGRSPTKAQYDKKRKELIDGTIMGNDLEVELINTPEYDALRGFTNQDNDLHGKSFLCIGCSSGTGFRSAVRLGSMRADVYACARTPSVWARHVENALQIGTAATAMTMGPQSQTPETMDRLHFKTCDVRNTTSIREFIAWARDKADAESKSIAGAVVAWPAHPGQPSKGEFYEESRLEDDLDATGPNKGGRFAPINPATANADKFNSPWNMQGIGTIKATQELIPLLKAHNAPLVMLGTADGFLTASELGSGTTSTSGSITASTSGSITASTSGSITASTSGSITASTSGSITASTSGSITASTSGSIGSFGSGVYVTAGRLTMLNTAQEVAAAGVQVVVVGLGVLNTDRLVPSILSFNPDPSMADAVETDTRTFWSPTAGNVHPETLAITRSNIYVLNLLPLIWTPEFRGASLAVDGGMFPLLGSGVPACNFINTTMFLCGYGVNAALAASGLTAEDADANDVPLPQTCTAVGLCSSFASCPYDTFLQTPQDCIGHPFDSSNPPKPVPYSVFGNSVHMMRTLVATGQNPLYGDITDASASPVAYHVDAASKGVVEGLLNPDLAYTYLVQNTLQRNTTLGTTLGGHLHDFPTVAENYARFLMAGLSHHTGRPISTEELGRPAWGVKMF